MRANPHTSASAIYFVQKNSAILLDCAEGTYSQLADHFNHDKEMLERMLKKTKVIFITHIHGDHQLGIFKMLIEIDKLDTNENLFLIIPPLMKELLANFIAS